LLLTSCTTSTSHKKFYGIQVDSEIYDDDFRIEGERYVIDNSSNINSGIQAVGAFIEISFSPKIQVRVFNKSNSPIRSNYFLDEFRLFTKDGKNYILGKKSISIYRPKNGYINPNEKVAFILSYPSGINEEDVLKIVAKFGYDTRIVLKPKSIEVVR